MSLSVLIIGCGNIAGGYDDADSPAIRSHAKAYRRNGNFTLAACVDPDPERAAAFARQWGVARHYTSIDDIAEREFDVVSLCSPAERHADHLQAMLDWPVRLVFCEKPLTLDIGQSRRLVADYQRSGRALAVNFQRRWEACVRQLQGEDWGRLLVANGLYTKGVQANGSHMIDLLQALLGPLKAEIATDAVIDYLPEDPTLGGVLRTESGAPVKLSVGDRGCFTVFELDLLFERGRVTFGDSGYSWCRRRVVDDARFAGYRILEPPVWQPTALDLALGEAIDNIADFLSSGRPLLSTGHTALATQETVAELMGLYSLQGEKVR